MKLRAQRTQRHPKGRKRSKKRGWRWCFLGVDDDWLTFLGFSNTLNAHMRYIALLLVAVVLTGQQIAAQLPTQSGPPKKDSSSVRQTQARTPQQVEIRKLFGLIQQGIVSSSLASASAHFAQQVFVNMSGGESGYFSANQTVSILQRYLSNRSSLSFEFSRFSDTGSTPFATGRLSCLMKGRRESAQVYVSLRYQNSRWVISQFNIY